MWPSISTSPTTFVTRTEPFSRLIFTAPSISFSVASATLPGNFDVALALGNVQVAAPAGYVERSLARNVDVHVGGDAVVAGAIGIGVQQYRVTIDGNDGLLPWL